MSRERILRTERLVATSWLACDVDDLLVVHSDAETMRFVRQGRPETREQTAALIDQYMAEHAATGFTKWRVTDIDGHLVGRAGFETQLDGRELAYTLRRDLWGQGLATEIGAALVSWHLANAVMSRSIRTWRWTTPPAAVSWTRSGSSLSGEKIIVVCRVHCSPTVSRPEPSAMGPSRCALDTVAR